MQAKIFVAIGLSSVFFSNCSPSSNSKQEDKGINTIELTQQQAAKIFSLPIHCLEVEYPNKMGEVLGSAADLKTPRQIRPVFYGCFDWHSSVHGYWSIVELMQKYPNLDADHKVRTVLDKHITAENVAVEMAFFQDENNANFERTYGWAWLFKLYESLDKWQDPDAQRWKANLKPLVDLLISKYKAYLPKLVFPIRTGTHDNSAFGLSLSLDYVRAVGDKEFEKLILEHSNRLFGKDVNANLAFEPSGHDFLSPSFEEAFLMSKIMDADQYKVWLKKFLPAIFEKDFKLEPAIVKDRSDGHLVHLDGLNYSRAACLYGISAQLPELNHLNAIAQKHIEFSLPNLSAQDDYMGSHWLGTFALYAIQHAH